MYIFKASVNYFVILISNMKFIISVLLSIIFFLASRSEPKAIIVIVPVILIPIVKIVALIIGAFAIPVVSLSTWYLKLKKKPIYFGILIGLIILIILGITITFGFKLVNPQRPLF